MLDVPVTRGMCYIRNDFILTTTCLVDVIICIGLLFRMVCVCKMVCVYPEIIGLFDNEGMQIMCEVFFCYNT